MNLALIPLLLTAILLAAADAGVDTVEVILSGQHQIDDHRGALIVGDATATIAEDNEVPGPIYVIGGQLIITGTVNSDVIQLAGTVTVESGGVIADELRYIGGTQSIDPDTTIGRPTQIAVNRAEQSPAAGYVLFGLVTLVMATIGSWLSRTRRTALDNVASAISDHAVVSLTVGTLLFLTAISVLVFMAFTLVLIPVTVIGLVVGAATLAFGVIAWGHLLGSRIPLRGPGFATGLGVMATMIALRIVGAIPVVGGLVALGVALTSLGATIITYYGASKFHLEAAASWRE